MGGRLTYPRAPFYFGSFFYLTFVFPGHQLNVNEYTTQELLEKVHLADSLFDQGNLTYPSSSRPSLSLMKRLTFAPPLLILCLRPPCSVSATGSDARLGLPRDGIQHARGQGARDESGRGRLRH